MVIKRSYSLSARSSSRLFWSQAQPINGTDSTTCPCNSRPSRQSRFSSRRILTSGGCQKLLARYFEQSDYLLAPDTGESLKEVVDGLPRFQVVEETLYRHARTDKNRRASQNL